MPLVAYLNLDPSSMETALRETCTKLQPIFFDVWLSGPGPISRRAWDIHNETFDWRKMSVGPNREDKVRQKYFECMQAAEVGSRWAKYLKEGVGADLKKPWVPNPDSAKKAKLIGFAEEQYGFDLLLGTPKIDNLAQKIISCVIDDGRKPPSAELLECFKPDAKDVSAAFLTAHKYVLNTSASILKDNFKPPDWLQDRLEQVRLLWTSEKEPLALLEKATDGESDLNLLAKCMEEAADCRSYAMTQQQGVWIAKPRKFGVESPEPWGDEGPSDDEAFFGPGQKG